MYIVSQVTRGVGGGEGESWRGGRLRKGDREREREREEKILYYFRYIPHATNSKNSTFSKFFKNFFTNDNKLSYIIISAMSYREN